MRITVLSTVVIDGDSNRVGAEFTYSHGDVHSSTRRVTEFVPGKRVVWSVVDTDLSFLKHRNEWTGTDIVFDLATKRGRPRCDSPT